MTKITIIAEDEKMEIRVARLERRMNALDDLEEEVTKQDKDVQGSLEEIYGIISRVDAQLVTQIRRIDDLENPPLPEGELRDDSVYTKT